MAEPEIRWDESSASTLRADVCQVLSSREETTLLFGATDPRQGAQDGAIREGRRIVVSPAVAKQLAGILARAARERSVDPDATPAGQARTRASAAGATGPIAPLLEHVNALGVDYGYERSFKFAPGQLLDDRVILGIRTRSVAPEALCDVCRGIGMPQDQLDQFADRLPEANTAGFGFEGGPRGGTYKVYLEFWDQLRQRVQRDPSNAGPGLLFLGFKWEAADPARAATARYTCHPLLSVQGILRRLDVLYDGRADSASLRATREIVARAARRIGNDSFVYVEAAEEGNPRQSFDLNLYKAGLRVGELQAVFSALCSAYAVDGGRLADVQASAANHPLGHLSGGLGRDGSDFLTAYYEIEGL